MSGPTGHHKALVLSGGGARGAYQAGVLKFIGQEIPGVNFETLVGSSAGAINVAGVASFGGEISFAGPRVADLWTQLQMRQVFRTDPGSLFKIGVQWVYSLLLGGITGRPQAHALVDTQPLREFLEGVFQPERVRAALNEGRLKNVAVSATEVSTGALITFLQSNSARPWQRARRKAVLTELAIDHIMASAAIPILFPSVLIGNRQYVDGCIRSTSPLGPATRLGADRILAIGVRRLSSNGATAIEGNPNEPEPRPTPAQLGALILNSLFAESLDTDVEHLERLNTILPDQREGSFGMKRVEALVIRPSEDLGEMATLFQDKVPPMVRFLLRGLGSEVGKSSDILSYLLFVPEYLQALVDLGYRDARAEEAKLRRFLQD
jgi:NTE family protein